MTINGFIIIVLIICGIGWAGAHWYDNWQRKQTRRAYRRDKNSRY